ncbi:MAG: signal peptidase I [Bryobacteraceae bacterium]
MKAAPSLRRPDQVAEAIRARGAVHLRVFGGSMMPWVRPGDILTVRHVEPARLHPGDIILYFRAGRMFVHRLLRVYRKGGRLFFLAKGDAMPRADAPVEESGVLGRISTVQRGRRLLNLDSPSQKRAARLLAKISPASRYYYPAGRLAWRLVSSAERLIGNEHKEGVRS